jgi:putative chitinase
MSEAMKKLQERCGVTADGAFGPNTARAIAKHYDLSPNRAAHLLGQAAHESGGFKLTKENLNYRAETMCRVWPSRFKTVEDAAPYARNPSALAEKVYSGRMGNGQEGSGDGSKYIGRGFIQLTGKDNYRSFASDMRVPDALEDPSLVETDYAFESAMWFFEKNGLMAIADKGVDDDTIKTITKRVNGGHHGLEDRAQWTKKIYGWLS